MHKRDIHLIWGLLHFLNQVSLRRGTSGVIDAVFEQKAV